MSFRYCFDLFPLILNNLVLGYWVSRLFENVPTKLDATPGEVEINSPKNKFPYRGTCDKLDATRWPSSCPAIPLVMKEWRR